MKTLPLAACALLLALAACAPAPSAEDTSASASALDADAPITMANWTWHPKIEAVTRIVEEVDASWYVPVTRTFCDGAGHGELERTKITDAHSVIRELVIGTGSADSTKTDSYYYDRSGRLRFAFLTESDVHGGASEVRVYFDERGDRIWELTRSISDPTLEADITTAPFTPTESDVVLDERAVTPGAWFDAPPSCN